MAVDGEERDILNQVNRDIDSLQTNYVAMQRDMAVFGQQLTDTRTILDTIVKKLDDRSRFHWQPIAAMSAIVVPVLLFAIPYFGTYVTTVVQPVAAATALNTEAIRTITGQIAILQQASDSSTAHDVASQTDRMQLNDRTKILETSLANEIAQRREQQAALRESQIEGETQIQAIYNLMNTTKSENQRLFGIVWQKAFPGMSLPDDTYFPRSTIAPNPGVATGNDTGK